MVVTIVTLFRHVDGESYVAALPGHVSGLQRKRLAERVKLTENDEGDRDALLFREVEVGSGLTVENVVFDEVGISGDVHLNGDGGLDVVVFPSE